MTELNDAHVGHDMKYLEAADRIHSDYPECQDRLVSESRGPSSRPEATLLPVWRFPAFPHLTSPHLTSLYSVTPDTCSSVSNSCFVLLFCHFITSVVFLPFYPAPLVHSSRSARHELAALSTGSSSPSLSPPADPIDPGWNSHPAAWPPDMTPTRPNHVLFR